MHSLPGLELCKTGDKIKVLLKVPLQGKEEKEWLLHCDGLLQVWALIKAMHFLESHRPRVKVL